MTAPVQELDLAQCWGVTVRRTGRTVLRPVGRHLLTAATTLAVTVTFLLGLAGTTIASTNNAHADWFGVSDAVEDWVCALVSPTEPWEVAGDGPESLISNLNLAGFVPVQPVRINAAGDRVTGALPATDGSPSTMDEVPTLPAGQPATLYELAGLRGLSWWTIPIAPDGTTRSCQLWDYVFSQAGNAIFTVNKLLLQVVISLKEAAAADDPLAFLYDEGNSAISTAFSVFFIPMAIFALICAGAWIGFSAVRGRGSRAALGTLAASIGIMVLGGFAYLGTNANGNSGFRAVSQVADGMINQLNAAAANGLFDGFTQGQGACALPTDDANPARGQRLTSCILADSLAYRPWAIGQFGAAGAAPIPLPDTWTVVASGADGDVPGAIVTDEHTLPCYVDFQGCNTDLRTYLIAQHGGLQVGDRLSGPSGYYQCSAKVTTAVAQSVPWLSLETSERAAISLAVSTPCSPMFRVFQVLVETDQRAAAAYAGGVGIARMSQASSSLVGTVVVGIPVLIVAVITMGWIAWTLGLWLTGPFKLGYAVFVGKAKIAREWLNDLMYAWLARLAYGIVLSLTILVVSWMMAADLSFGLRLLWLGIILVAFWKLIGKVQELIRPQNSSAGDLSTKIQDKTADLGRKTVQSGAGASSGVRDSFSQQRDLMSDPTRGRTRRTISALATPVAVGAGAVRGATGRPARSGAAPAGPGRGSAPASTGSSGAAPKKKRFTRTTRISYGAPVPPSYAPYDDSGDSRSRSADVDTRTGAARGNAAANVSIDDDRPTGPIPAVGASDQRPHPDAEEPAPEPEWYTDGPYADDVAVPTRKSRRKARRTRRAAAAIPEVPSPADTLDTTRIPANDATRTPANDGPLVGSPEHRLYEETKAGLDPQDRRWSRDTEEIPVVDETRLTDEPASTSRTDADHQRRPQVPDARPKPHPGYEWMNSYDPPAQSIPAADDEAYSQRRTETIGV